MSAKRFLDRVEQTGLVDASVLARLRQQVGSSAARITAEAVAEILVQNRYLTRPQATKLLAQAAGQRSDAEGDPRSRKTVRPTDTARAEDVAGRSAAPADGELGLAPLDDEEEELTLTTGEEDEEVVMLEDASGEATGEPGLAPLDDQDLPQPLGGPTSAAPGPVNEPSGLQPLGATPGLEPIDASPGLQPLDGSPGLEPVGGPPGLEPVGGPPGLEPVGGPPGLVPVGGPPGLEPLDATAGYEGGLEPAAGATAPAARLPRARRKKNVWDSKLLLVGGGALIVLILLFIGLYFFLHRGTATEMFQAAEEDYRSEAYSQAIAKYEKFLKRFPDDPNVSLARVRIGTAKLWQAVGVSDKRVALEATGEVLPQIENEDAFSEARPELASILPEIAEGFSSQAKAQQDIDQAQELVDLAEQAMELVNAPKYIPTSLRTPIQATINRILEDIELAKRNINRTKRLTEAVAEIRKKAEAGDTVAAYEVRRKLLGEYPGLEQDESLVEAVRSITERERALVKVVAEPIPPLTEDLQPRVDFQVALASRRSEQAAGSENQTVCFLARGAVYGLRASDGKLLWRRYVGQLTRTHPQPLSQQAGADVIAADGQRNELLRLRGQSGEPVWRLPLGEPFADPVIVGKRILVATESGRVVEIETDTGTSPKQVRIPQKLQTPPGTSKLRHLYQVGEHSNLYVLDEDSLECREVYYLGHKPGTVATPPVMALGHLFVAVNSGIDYCDLHVLAVDENGRKLKPAMKPIRLGGHVLIAPLPTGARIVLVTDRGATHVLEVNPADPDKPVLDAVEPVVASFKTPLTGYFAIDGGRLFVGNDRFTGYEIQTSQARLIRKWIKDERDVFVAPPQVIGDTVYHLRRRQHSPSYTAAAIHVDDGRVLWEVDLATPAALLSVDMEKRMIHSVSQEAELFEVTSETFQAGLLDQSSTTAAGASRTVAFNVAVPLDQDRWVLASPQDPKRIVLYDPNSVSASGRLQARPVKAVGDAQVTAPPTALGDGLLLPLDNGQVVLVDPATGDSKVLPFQARVAGGAKVQWRVPAVVGTDPAEFVIADDQGRLYRVGIQSTPTPHLDKLAEAKLKLQIASALASAGDTVYAVVRGPASDTIVSLAAADLAAGSEWPLNGRIVWGPHPAGDVVLAASDQDGLLCFQAGQKQRWKAPLPYGAPVGRPLAEGNDFVLSSATGVVWRVSGADGTELRKTDVGQPLGGGAVPFGSRLLLSASDGTLLVIPALAEG